MVKSIGKRIIFIAVFISGNGSNLKSLIKNFKNIVNGQYGVMLNLMGFVLAKV